MLSFKIIIVWSSKWIWFYNRYNVLVKGRTKRQRHKSNEKLTTDSMSETTRKTKRQRKSNPVTLQEPTDPSPKKELYVNIKNDRWIMSKKSLSQKTRCAINITEKLRRIQNGTKNKERLTGMCTFIFRQVKS